MRVGGKWRARELLVHNPNIENVDDAIYLAEELVVGPARGCN